MPSLSKSFCMRLYSRHIRLYNFRSNHIHKKTNRNRYIHLNSSNYNPSHFVLRGLGSEWASDSVQLHREWATRL